MSLATSVSIKVFIDRDGRNDRESGTPLEVADAYDSRSPTVVRILKKCFH